MTPFQTTLLALLCALTVAADELPDPLSDDFINLINRKQNMWKAGRNFPVNTPFEHIKSLMGALQDDHIKKLPKKTHHADLIASLPENFDSRDKWSNCPTINEIRDQGECGSCWAFGAVEAMTDRVCIYSNGTQQFHFSAEDLLTCCEDCVNRRGCIGGFTSQAWLYWQKTGIVSGGNYNTSEGCMPYKIPHWRKHPFQTPDCVKACEPNYNVPYEQDKRYGENIYHIAGEQIIKAELYENGPVEATFTVFEDFLTYKTGVYKHINGTGIGHHAIKIIGWGVESDGKYWLVANSWGTAWGDKGFFKILRGENHCDIESNIVAGKPRL